jgi:hypothetical protein
MADREHYPFCWMCPPIPFPFFVAAKFHATDMAKAAT